jgi:hypothetical protein
MSSSFHHIGPVFKYFICAQHMKYKELLYKDGVIALRGKGEERK